jgi:hypothetical protein
MVCGSSSLCQDVIEMIRLEKDEEFTQKLMKNGKLIVEIW